MDNTAGKPKLDIKTLGGLSIRLDGEPIKGFKSRKVEALLVYLAVETDKPHRREALITLLWPDLLPSSVRANLRQTLYLLRQAIPEVGPREGDDLVPLVLVDNQCAQINPLADVAVDVHRFEELIDQDPEAAVALYGGDFLADFYLSDSNDFEAWVSGRRADLRRRVLATLERLTEGYLERGEYEPAQEYARQQLAIDNLREVATQQLLVALAGSGKRNEALAHYEVYHQNLASELKVKPSEQTRAIYERLLAGELPGPPGVEVVLEREPRAVGECPYRGLAAFREVDAPFFHGREAFTERLAEAVEKQALVAVIVGSSGSGKSSVVFAGLLPRLREDQDWQIVSLRPGSQPYQALAAALVPLLEPEMSETDRLIETEKLAGVMRAGELVLDRVVARALMKSQPASRLLLVVDQFEELYTLCPDADLRSRFLDALLEATETVGKQQPSPFVLLMTLRADFMGQALTSRPFADALQEGSLILGPMNREELQAAIEKPAGDQGAAFETGLVSRLLDDVGEEPGNLPLLEFALTLLWDQLEYGWLTHAAYEAVGRVEGALARYAEEVYANLEGDEQEMARRIFVQLVQPGQGTEDTRRVALREDFGEKEWELVQHLADKRLVVTGLAEGKQETAEVVHETLIRSWGRLQEWMDADRAFRIWQEGLRLAIRGWEESGQDEGALLRGGPLVIAENWLTERETELSSAERAFIKSSLELRSREQERRERRRRRTILGLATGLVIALVLALAAGQQWRRADLAGDVAIAQGITAQANADARATAQSEAEGEANARATAQTEAEVEAKARATAQADALSAKEDALVQASIGLASQVLLELEGANPERAVPLALAAVEYYPYTWQAERALGQAVLGSRMQFILHHQELVNSVTWSPTGDRLATASWDGTAKIWDASTGKELFTLLHDDKVSYPVWSPDGRRLLSIDDGGTAKLWDSATGEELFSLSGQDWLWGAAWSPEGDRVVTGSYDSTVKMWDATTGEELFTLSGHTEGVLWLAWSPLGDRLATASEDGTARIWDVITGEEIFAITGHTSGIHRVTWSPSGDRLITSTWDSTAKIWDMTTGDEIVTLEKGGRDAHWSPDGSTILTSGNGFADVWDPETGEKLLSLFPMDYSGSVRTGGFSPSGEHVATLSYEGVAQVWDATSGEELFTLRGHHGPMTGAAPICPVWSPSGDRLATASADGSAIVWDLSPALLTLRGNEPVSATAWSPESDRIVMAYNTHAIVWDAATGEQLLRFSVKKPLSVLDWDPGIEFVAWSPDGDKILTIDVGDGEGGVPGLAGVYDANTGDELLLIPAIGMWEITAAWFPDGDRVLLLGDDGQTEVWDVMTGENLLRIDPIRDLNPDDPLTMPTGTALSPKEDLIVTTYVEGTAKIYDATSGEEVLSLNVSDTWTALPAWSSDGRFIFTQSEDDIGGRKWDASTGELVMTFSSFLASNHSWSPAGDRFMKASWGTGLKVINAETGAELLDFNTGERYFDGDWSPDGSRFVVAGQFGVATVYPAWQSLEDLIAYAKECCVIRELTPDEREMFGLPPR